MCVELRSILHYCTQLWRNFPYWCMYNIHGNNHGYMHCEEHMMQEPALATLFKHTQMQFSNPSTSHMMVTIQLVNTLTLSNSRPFVDGGEQVSFHCRHVSITLTSCWWNNWGWGRWGRSRATSRFIRNSVNGELHALNRAVSEKRQATCSTCTCTMTQEQLRQ